MTDDKRLPYRDNDDAEELAVPCAVCGTMVPVWNDPNHIRGQVVYCLRHRIVTDSLQ